MLQRLRMQGLSLCIVVQGGAAKDKATGMTSFETAQAAWGGRAGISSRGVVGAEGDIGGREVWLG
jgi:hypothetical protein